MELRGRREVAQRRGFSFNAAAFYTDIKNLQVTLDAGSCSSRIVFNVPKAHSMGVEVELSAHAGRRPGPVVQRAAWSRPSSIRPLPDGTRRRARRHSRGQPPAVACRSSSSRRARTYNFPIADRRRRLCRRLVPARRQPLHAAERPGEQSAHLRLRPAVRRRDRRRGDDRRSQAARPTTTSTSAPGSIGTTASA